MRFHEDLITFFPITTIYRAKIIRVCQKKARTESQFLYVKARHPACAGQAAPIIPFIIVFRTAPRPYNSRLPLIA